MTKSDASVTQRSLLEDAGIASASTHPSLDEMGAIPAVGSRPSMRTDAYIGQTLEGRSRGATTSNRSLARAAWVSSISAGTPSSTSASRSRSSGAISRRIRR